MRRRHHSFALALASFGWAASSVAQPAVVDPFGPLARAVRVTGVSVPDGPGDGFSARMQATMEQAVHETIAARGQPRLTDRLPERRGILLLYPDGLVLISGFYSTRVICRVEIGTEPLRDGVDVAQVTELAARACRNEEVRGWGRENLPEVHTIGAAQLPGAGGIGLSIVATDNLGSLLGDLSRRARLERGTNAILVRDDYPNEISFSRDRTYAIWRYAWFADGYFIAIRQDIFPEDTNSFRAMRLSCVVQGPARGLPALESGPIAGWCDGHLARLRPGLAAYAAAVRDFDRAEAALRPETGPIVPSAGAPPFHRLATPPGLAARYWAGDAPR